MLMIVPKSETGAFDVNLGTGVEVISNRQAKYFRSLAKAKDNIRVIEFPNWKCFNGQALKFQLQNVGLLGDFSLGIQQVVSPDGNAVRGVVAANLPGFEQQTALYAKEGESTMVDLSKLLKDQPDFAMWMIWTPTVTRNSVGL